MKKLTTIVPVILAMALALPVAAEMTQEEAMKLAQQHKDRYSGSQEELPEPVKLTVHLNGNPVRLGIAWRADAAAPRSVILVRVAAGSAADLAGLKVADRIYAVAGKSFSSSDEFQKLM